MQSVTIPNGVTSIEADAFYLCPQLKSLTIPAKVTSVGAGAAMACGWLTSLKFEGPVPSGWFALVPGPWTEVSYNEQYADEWKAALASEGLPYRIGAWGGTETGDPGQQEEPDEPTPTPTPSNIQIGDLTYTLDNDAATVVSYKGIGGLVSIPTQIRHEGTLYTVTKVSTKGTDWNGVTSVIISGFVAEIDTGAFEGCSTLQRVEISGDKLHIGDYAFRNCSALATVVMSSGVASMGKGVFAGCGSLNFVGMPSGFTTIPESTFEGCRGLASMTIPANISSIGKAAFANCVGLQSIAIPSKVRAIGDNAFDGCIRLTEIGLVNGIATLGEAAFANCCGLGSLEIPSSVLSIGNRCFCCCTSLKQLSFMGDAPMSVGAQLLGDTPLELIVIVPDNSTGWNPNGSASSLPKRWPFNTESGRAIRRVSDVGAEDPFVSSGFVTVITEIISSSGAVSVPASWAKDFAKFEQLYGKDFAAALTKPTGKRGANGNELSVWQDYVAGTDPTDETDVFTASITIVDGKVQISYSPELDDARKALRKYTTWGKKSLMDTNWTEVPEGHEAEYNFFRVTVEMK